VYWLYVRTGKPTGKNGWTDRLFPGNNFPVKKPVNYGSGPEKRNFGPEITTKVTERANLWGRNIFPMTYSSKR
jgi:hypothetical protein